MIPRLTPYAEMLIERMEAKRRAAEEKKSKAPTAPPAPPPPSEEFSTEALLKILNE
jgi:hypothetical protein